MKPSRAPAYRRAKYAQKNPAQTFSVDVDVESLMDFITATQEDIEAAARPVAQAGAQVLYEAVLRNVDGRAQTGNLSKSIYQAYSTHDSTPAKAVYHISWNPRKAPHAHLVEFGHIQRYAVNLAPDGNWYTVVRAEHRANKKTGKQGTPPPKRNATQSEKDAYYVLRPGGPQQIAAQPFVRPAVSLFPAAEAAMREKFYEVMGHVL